jgi:predicted Fe-Mo cluster-binding NifX family protein
MRIVISAQGENLEAPASPVFGRCPTYVFVDTDTMRTEAMPNPAMNQGGGAGIQAAQFVVEQGAEAVLSGNLGPNAFDVLEAAGIPVYLISEGTVREAVEAFKAGRVQRIGDANVVAHSGMGGGAGLSMGTGRGMRRGMGRGMRMGQRGGFQAPMPAEPAPEPHPDSELAQLRETLQSLRQQLAETMDRIERLEGK